MSVIGCPLLYRTAANHRERGPFIGSLKERAGGFQRPAYREERRSKRADSQARGVVEPTFTPTDSLHSRCLQRVRKQLSNAQDKLERAQRHAEDRRLASQQTIERLEREYEEMAVERRDNDKQVEEMRAEADDVERKVGESAFDWWYILKLIPFIRWLST